MSDSARDRNVSDMEDQPATGEPLKDVPSKDQPSAGMRSEREAMTESTRTGQEPMRSSTAAGDPMVRQPVESDGWRGLSDVEQRFHELEAEFIKEPQAAVKKAETLIEEAVERITRQLHDEVARMRGHAEVSDTEQLRVAMLSYRTLIESIGGRRAA